MTTTIDLDEMSLKELKALQKRVARAIDGYEERERQRALAALESQAREMGFSLGELTGSVKAGRSLNPPKYRHPEDPTITWTGRGRQPDWMKEALANGRSKEEFLIA